MRYYLQNNIINNNIVARNYCRGARRKNSTIRTKTVESVLTRPEKSLQFS